MQYHRLKSLTADTAVIKLAAKIISSGGVAILPTDTIYGFSVRADSPRAVKKLRALKKRDGQKPFLVLVDSIVMLKRYAFLSPAQEKKLRSYWRAGVRPTTIILRSRGLLPKSLSAADGSLALRLPKSKFLIKIIGIIKKPLISTSLNISGEAGLSHPALVEQVWPRRRLQPDLVVDAGAVKKRRPSRLIDLRNAAAPLILRK